MFVWGLILEDPIYLGAYAFKVFLDDSDKFSPNGIGRVRVVGVLVGEM